jgi:hypothetical protein
MLGPALLIRDILERIRLRIRGSVPLTYVSEFESGSQKEVKSSRNQGFLHLLLVDGRIRIRICTNNDESGSGRPKNLRILVHNTV